MDLEKEDKKVLGVSWDSYLQLPTGLPGIISCDYRPSGTRSNVYTRVGTPPHTNTCHPRSNPESQKGKSDLSLLKAELCLHCSSPGVPDFLNTLSKLQVRCGLVGDESLKLNTLKPTSPLPALLFSG